MESIVDVVVLVAIAVVGAALARRLGMVAPLVLLVAGLGLSYVPGFPEAHLEPELVLVGCTGPQTNYQCDGRSENEPKHMETITTVSGTIYCHPGQVKR